MILLTSLVCRPYAGVTTRIIQRRGEGMPRANRPIRVPSPPGPAWSRGLIRRPNTSAQHGSWMSGISGNGSEVRAGAESGRDRPPAIVLARRIAA